MKINLYLEHDSKEITYSDLNFLDKTSKLSVLTSETTLDVNDDDYVMKNVVLKNAEDPITIKSGRTLTVDKATIKKNAKIKEINVKTVSGSEGADSTNVNEFITQSLMVGGPSSVQNIEGKFIRICIVLMFNFKILFPQPFEHANCYYCPYSLAEMLAHNILLIIMNESLIPRGHQEV